MSSPSVQEPAGTRWHARPVLATVLRVAVLVVPLLVATGAVLLAGRLLPDSLSTGWTGLVVLLVIAVGVSAVVERGARRLLPIAVLLRLSTVFPDRAPSRFRLARAAAVRSPREQLLWADGSARPTSTSELVLHLVGALGRHDRRTRGHSERVRVLCDVLARDLGLSADDRDRLRWSALLHDVGKVQVAPAVLNKPAALDDREFATVKEHPAAGAALAAPLLPWLGDWGDGILDHHERWDGRGYPSGKAGEHISYAGRLIAVVDAFETMTAARPYKRAVGTRTAREELARCAGSHFDPAMVRAFLGVSLPRVLWALGPLAFVLQLPYARPLAHAGSRTAVALPGVGSSLATGAAGVAGAAVLATGAGAATAPPAVAAPLAPAVSSASPSPAAAAPSPAPVPVPAPADPAPPVPARQPAPAVASDREAPAQPVPVVAVPVARPVVPVAEPAPPAAAGPAPTAAPSPAPTAAPTASARADALGRPERCPVGEPVGRPLGQPVRLAARPARCCRRRRCSPCRTTPPSTRPSSADRPRPRPTAPRSSSCATSPA